MTVKIIPLESGRFLVTWLSMKEKQPDCTAYDILMDGNFQLNKYHVREEGKKEYSAVVEIPAELFERFVKGTLLIEVVALGHKNRKTKTAEAAVYAGPKS